MARSRVKLPPGVKAPFEVYVNGVRQELGSDYQVRAGELLFERELVQLANTLPRDPIVDLCVSRLDALAADGLLGVARVDLWSSLFHMHCNRFGIDLGGELVARRLASAHTAAQEPCGADVGASGRPAARSCSRHCRRSERRSRAIRSR